MTVKNDPVEKMIEAAKSSDILAFKEGFARAMAGRQAEAYSLKKFDVARQLFQTTKETK